MRQGPRDIAKQVYSETSSGPQASRLRSSLRPRSLRIASKLWGFFEKTLPEIWKRLSFVRISWDHCRAGFCKYHSGAWSIGLVQRLCCAHLSRCRNERHKKIAQDPLTLLEKPTRCIGSGLPVGSSVMTGSCLFGKCGRQFWLKRTTGYPRAALCHLSYLASRYTQDRAKR